MRHFFFVELLILQEILYQNFRFFLSRIDQLEPVQPDHCVSLYGALILVILKPKSYLARVHKPHISPRHGLGPVLGHVMGCFQPTFGPLGYLVVKKMS